MYTELKRSRSRRPEEVKKKRSEGEVDEEEQSRSRRPEELKERTTMEADNTEVEREDKGRRGGAEKGGLK